ncbi:MAG: DNA polymerase III subunit gamma/tau [Bacteroidetes bacterium]|nr:DNA polymerase III subunit gamma/tau [Bacteroidota bacterium]
MSEQYQVSARKYRPQTFDTVVGQEHITTTLKNAIRSGHLAHAFLFCGPRGVGKTTCARILARTINCENPTAETEACGVCPTCQSFNNNGSFNVFELDAASNNGVDEMRELTAQVRFTPQQGKYKIYIIDEVHMLSTAAFNAFLKTLEEPPPYAIFILATTEKHKILPTILSRCQIFDFKRITSTDTVRHLEAITKKEGLEADEAALHVIAQKSEGCMRDSLSMLDRIASFTGGHITYGATMEHLAMLDALFYFQLTDALLAEDLSGMMLQLDAILEKGFEGNVVLEGLSEHFRNLMLCKDHRMAKLLDVPGEHKRMYFDKAQQAPLSFLLSALHVLNDSELKYRDASNKRLHTELCLMRLCYLMQATGAKSITTTEAPISAEPHAIPAPPPSSPASATGNRLLAAMGKPAASPKANHELTAPPKVDNPPNEIPQTTPEEQPKTGGRRVSSGFMDNLNAILQTATTDQVSKKDLTQEDAERLFSNFQESLKAEGRSVLYSQVLQMKVVCADVDELKLISSTEITDSYAQSLRNELIELFSNIFGRTLRITTELQEDVAAQSNTPTVLSKQEIFDEINKRNPLVGRLKDGLGLQVDY